MLDLDDMTDTDLDQLHRAVIAEQERRRILTESAAQLEQVTAAYQAAIGRQDGDEWVQPTHALDAYAHGAVVALEDRHFRSLHAANVWPPTDPHGAQWWLEVWPDPDNEGGWVTENPDADGPEPWNPEQTYYPPATVTHDGKTWTLAHANALPGWEPGGPGMQDVWKEVQ